MTPEVNTCSHCTGVLQSWQMKWNRGCLCACHIGSYEDAYKEGFRACQKKAVEIVDRHESGKELCAEGVADRIRKMSAE